MHDRQPEVFTTPYVVRRTEIPPRSGAGDGALESRTFVAHEGLAHAMRSAAATLSWVEARPNQYVAPWRSETPGMLIVLRGRAKLIGSTEKSVEQGDVITLLKDHEYGFSVGASGLEALQVLFREDDGMSEREVTMDDVLARNEARLQDWLKTSYFRMLQGGALDSSSRRKRFRQCLRVFSDFFQTFLFTRQAMCREDAYCALFNTHLAEEFGHNRMLRPSDDAGIAADPCLQATLSWFCQQMLVLDNVGKAVINLVLESGGYHFHTIAKPIFKGDDMEGYFDTHAEGDEQHKEMGIEFLEGQHPLTYRDLLRLADDAWDMLEATTQRIVELVHQEEAVS